MFYQQFFLELPNIQFKDLGVKKRTDFFLLKFSDEALRSNYNVSDTVKGA